MYLLDTNVISELRKAKSGKANKNVVAWANSVSATSLFLSVITILELETGTLLVERRDPVQGAILRSWLNAHVLPAFSDRILAVDTAVAQCCARLHVPDPRSDRDAIIAATASVHGMAVVTRNVDDFKPTGVEILNPWDLEISDEK
ncbi:MAG: type II toxin-antitoxin system VapC family toxin [Nitrospira sp.]